MFALQSGRTFLVLSLCLFSIVALTVPSVTPDSIAWNSTNEATNITATSNIVEIIDVISATSSTTTTIESSDSSVKCKSKAEAFSNCTNSCPASCEDPQRKACRNFCWSGCECAPGYVKNHRWQCIPSEDCPKCAANEHYRNCGSNCEPTCDTYQNLPVYCSNRASCKRGCFCDYGYVRTMNGTCVAVADCPQKCPPNEYWDVNGEPCIRSAENPRPKCLFEIPQPGCICNTGYKRNPLSKECEPISPLTQGFEAKCGVNETYSYCDSECARNCFDENKRQMCPTICHRGCFCNEGYRRENSGRCVLPEDCRSWSGSFGSPVRV